MLASMVSCGKKQNSDIDDSKSEAVINTEFDKAAEVISSKPDEFIAYLNQRGFKKVSESIEEGEVEYIFTTDLEKVEIEGTMDGNNVHVYNISIQRRETSLEQAKSLYKTLHTKLNDKYKYDYDSNVLKTHYNTPEKHIEAVGALNESQVGENPFIVGAHEYAGNSSETCGASVTLSKQDNVYKIVLYVGVGG